MTDTPLGAQRMPSLPPDEWPDDIRAHFAALSEDPVWRNSTKYNFTHWFANHPELATAWLRYNGVLAKGVFDPRLRELVVLRVSNRYQCEYEWHLHAQISAAMGIGAAELEAIKAGPDDPRWSEVERLCLQATDALCDKHDIDDALWADLLNHFDRKQVMELMFLVGSYALLAWVLNTVRMPVEDL